MLKLTILAIAIATTTTAALADTKCSPDVNVEYLTGSGTSIKVTKIKYRLDGTSVWHTEGVTNKVINKGKDHTYKSQRLGSVAKGQKLDLRAVFKPDTGSGYGAEQDGPILSSNTNCENNVKYSIKVN